MGLLRGKRRTVRLQCVMGPLVVPLRWGPTVLALFRGEEIDWATLN
jgi:hypothetical protein